MDTATATPTAKRAVELRKQLAGLDTRKREAESALAREHDVQQKATGERITLVAELVGADSATAGWAHGEIDRLDSALRVSSRLSEGPTSSISRITSEIESLRNELEQVERTIAAEAHAEGLRVFAAQLNELRRSAEEAMGNARAALAALNLTASRGAEQYGLAAQTFATGLFEAFRHQQLNPELLGWRDSRPNFANLQFTVRPMAKA